MPLVKRTYTIRPDIVERFESRVPVGERSNVTNGLPEEWIEEQERERLREGIIEGCREMWDVYLEIERECHPLGEEVYRCFDL